MENAVYLYEYNKNVEAVYQNLEFKDGGLDHKQIIFRYDVILDKWFSVPQMKTMMKYASLTADRNLVYLIGGGIHHGSRQSVVAKGYVKAYDHRLLSGLNFQKPVVLILMLDVALSMKRYLLQMETQWKSIIQQLGNGKWLNVILSSAWLQVTFDDLISFDNNCWPKRESTMVVCLWQAEYWSKELQSTYCIYLWYELSEVVHQYIIGRNNCGPSRIWIW